MGHAIATLDEDNALAWRLFPVIYSRLSLDVPGVASAVLAAVTADMTPDEVADLMKRLNIIYDIMVPPTPSK